MALTTEDAQILNGLFPFDQHEFNPRGFVYISEQAICARLDQVDPSWHWDIKSVQVRDNVAVCVGTLTVKGVTREGVGMDKILENAGEAEKSAATDALKRAARLFGIGRYLLDNPKEGEFKKWLAAQQNSARKAATELPAPAANGWTEDQARSLVTEARQLNVSNDELLALLNVTRISEYAPGFSAARENLKRYAKARPPADPPPQEVVF